MTLDLDAYLGRLGVDRPESASPGVLRDLHAAHLARVPFENLDIPLGRRLSLDLDDLAAKIVERRRGGFCYELNGLFAHALEQLGFQVILCGAAVVQGDRIGPPLDHAALIVTCADATRWLVDVGFGDHSRYPLRWDFDVDQDDPDGVFRLEQRPHGDVAVLKDGSPEYVLEARPRRLEEFRAMCWYQQTSPDSHFTRSVVCTRTNSDGRVTLSGERLIVTRSGVREETRLSGDAEILAAYRDYFGIELDAVPRHPLAGSQRRV